MNLYLKLKLINSISKIFTIKTGRVIKFENKYYQTNKIISKFFKLFYLTTINIFFLFFLFLFQPHFFDNLTMRIIESIVTYLLIEYLIAIIIPLKEVSKFKDLKKEINERKYGNY